MTVKGELSEEKEASVVLPQKPRRRRVIRRSQINSRNSNAIPESISKNKALLSAISSSLPSDYDFEILKTIWRIEQSKAQHVALQMPEGLLIYSCIIADILRNFSKARSLSILGDVSYGACCVDDLGAEALGADLLVHYGHSCLVPLTTTVIPCLYVFVEINIDVHHAVESFCKTCEVGTRVHVMGVVQFRTSVAAIAKLLNERDRTATIPQAKPLSPGEVLGCTAPADLGGTAMPHTNPEQTEGTKHVMLFIADGRFHLEAAMIANPTLRALRYDPYSKSLTDERYETEKMKYIRHCAIKKAMDPSVKVFGIILGTLGRQGNPGILGNIRSLLRKHGKKSFVLLLSEIFPKKLDMFPNVDAWVQIACPRLSIDWGHFFNKPVLSPYELNVCLGEEEFREVYPMDFYKLGSGPWTNYHDDNRRRQIKDI
mmetsp:Transcript_21772/g.30547  ORF Transcript_21772/g.30547 Transcript_21772/m.30547 type:complete len:429 (+) Transcript_21772:73-1359(+)|eukprot:CAMPEP_0184871434 /NCGR_PEP_ID=MMETSP0580-20130426/40719_1 /TAXON_ID=1118495 /ORGANISM="Dactyliosolen fragilissimus" /LENGTH=428 /DNA_ID=CAMNT_0027374095 /DNA_START=71 /DNA_END=1357 /DNA_ORIENTATION=+